MKVFLVRHGQSKANKARVDQGKNDKWINTCLTLTGKKQAKKVAKRLRDEEFDLIYSSPLKRAKQTAKIINKFHNKKILFEDRIKEYHPFSEEKEDFIKRVLEFYKEIEKRKENILIVAHGGVIMSILAFSTKNRKKGGILVRRHSSETKNTSVSVLEKIKDGFKIIALNSIHHLNKKSNRDEPTEI